MLRRPITRRLAQGGFAFGAAGGGSRFVGTFRAGGAQDATGRDKSLAAIMEAVAEAEMRGITFLPVDIAKSCATIFTIEKGSIRLPLVSVASLSDTAARSVVQAREERPFSSIQDLRDRTRLTRSHIDILRETGALAGLPETDQLSLF